MLRGAFWLLAIVILLEVGTTILAAIGCMYMVIFAGSPIGSCGNLTQQIRETWAEILAAILALLLAARSNNGNGNGKP